MSVFRHEGIEQSTTTNFRFDISVCIVDVVVAKDFAIYDFERTDFEGEAFFGTYTRLCAVIVEYRTPVVYAIRSHGVFTGYDAPLAVTATIVIVVVMLNLGITTTTTHNRDSRTPIVMLKRGISVFGVSRVVILVCGTYFSQISINVGITHDILNLVFHILVPHFFIHKSGENLLG